jgi:hypothetical protein
VKNNREEAREGSGELVMFSILIWKVILWMFSLCKTSSSFTLWCILLYIYYTLFAMIYVYYTLCIKVYQKTKNKLQLHLLAWGIWKIWKKQISK